MKYLTEILKVFGPVAAVVAIVTAIVQFYKEQNWFMLGFVFISVGIAVFFYALEIQPWLFRRKRKPRPPKEDLPQPPTGLSDEVDREDTTPAA